MNSKSYEHKSALGTGKRAALHHSGRIGTDATTSWPTYSVVTFRRRRFGIA